MLGIRGEQPCSLGARWSHLWECRENQSAFRDTCLETSPPPSQDCGLCWAQLAQSEVHALLLHPPRMSALAHPSGCLADPHFAVGIAVLIQMQVGSWMVR